MISVSTRTSKSGTNNKIKNERTRRVELSAYTASPDIEFNIDEFEQYAVSRLNVLRWIEKQSGLGLPIKDNIHNIIRKYNLHIPLNDQISHFIGRLCFCQTTDRRKWFLQTEKALFEARYVTSTDNDKICVHEELCKGISSYDTYYKNDIIRDDELNGKSPIPYFKNGVEIRNEKEMLPFYKVPFQDVISLIGRRSVYLLNGYAYVPNNRFFSLITGKFRAHLNRGLISAKKAIDKMKNDPITMECVSRVIHIINGLHKITSGPAYKINKDKKAKITHKDVNKLSSIHFPLCMQSSIDHLRNDKHLKHGGRMHLGLFLKGIGLSLNDSIIYFRNHFTKIGGDKFNKQYAYNIRHNYGKEGKRIDYTPYSCSKIISCTPNNEDFHGCPYKIFDINNLRKYLAVNKKMNSSDIEEILNLVKNNHYQLGCRAYFNFQHKDIMKKKKIKIDDIESRWSHPNEYFDSSYTLYHGQNNKNEEEKEKETVETNNDISMKENHNNINNTNRNNNNRFFNLNDNNNNNNNH